MLRFLSGSREREKFILAAQCGSICILKEDPQSSKLNNNTVQFLFSKKRFPLRLNNQATKFTLIITKQFNIYKKTQVLLVLYKKKSMQFNLKTKNTKGFSPFLNKKTLEVQSKIMERFDVY